MKKKNKIIIIVLIFLVVIFTIGFTFDTFFNQEKSFKVGTSEFLLPEGYHEGVINPYGDVNITDGVKSIFLSEYDNKNISIYIDQYKNISASNNQSVTIENFTFDNLMIYKSNNSDNPNNVRYWYTKDNKTYTIYTWDGKLDSIITGLIHSQK